MHRSALDHVARVGVKFETDLRVEDLYHLGTATRRRVDRIETSLTAAGVDPVERSMVAAPGLDEPVTIDAAVEDEPATVPTN